MTATVHTCRMGHCSLIEERNTRGTRWVKWKPEQKPDDKFRDIYRRETNGSPEWRAQQAMKRRHPISNQSNVQCANFKRRRPYCLQHMWWDTKSNRKMKMGRQKSNGNWSMIGFRLTRDHRRLMGVSSIWQILTRMPCHTRIQKSNSLSEFWSWIYWHPEPTYSI